MQRLDAQRVVRGELREELPHLNDAPAGARLLALEHRRLLRGILRVLPRRLGVDGGAHDEHLVSRGDLLDHPLPDPAEPGGLLGQRRDVGRDAGAAGRHGADRGDIEVTEDGHRDGARNGSRRQDEHMRAGALRTQRLALLDAETVLLVDDDEPEVGERRGGAQQRMGADDDPRLAGCRAQRRLTTFGRRQLSGEERRHELGRELRTQHPRDGAHVLGGEHLGRRDERGLAAGLGDLQHGAQRDERLSGADLALHETVHRPVAGEVRADPVADGDLIGRPREGQTLVERGQQAARLAGRGRHCAHELALLQQRRLQHERLVHAQGAPRGVDLIDEVGRVDALQRGAGVEQALREPELLRQRIGHVAELTQHLGDRPLHLPGGHGARGGIDRDRGVLVSLRRQSREVDVLEELIVGMGELLVPLEDPDLAREDALASHLQVVLSPRLVEESEHERPGAVADHDLEDRSAALLHRAGRHRAHLGDDRHLLPQRQRGDRREFAAARVAAGVVREEVRHGVHAERALEQLRRGGTERVDEARLERQHGHASSLCRCGDTPSAPYSDRVIRRLLARLYWLCSRWRLRTEPTPTRPTVLVGAPHTSNWDFVLMLAIAWRLGIHIRWLGKASLFAGWRGRVMRALGGIAVDRSDAARVVAEIVARVNSGEVFSLVVTPDGTRGGNAYWKSGFYRIARETGMPVTLGYVDRTTMTTGLGPTIALTGDVAADMDRIRAFYADKAGLRPERRTEPRLSSEDAESPA